MIALLFPVNFFSLLEWQLVGYKLFFSFFPMNTIESLLLHIILKILTEKLSGLLLPVQLYFCSFLYSHRIQIFISYFIFSAVTQCTVK